MSGNDNTDEVSLRDIYNLLFAGKRLQLSFPSKDVAEGFRVRLFRFKKRQDVAMVRVDMLPADQLQRLAFRYDPSTSLAVLKFEDKPDQRQYTIQILESDDDELEE